VTLNHKEKSYRSILAAREIPLSCDGLARLVADDDRLKYCSVTQIGIINSVRNDVLHYGADFDGDGLGMFVTNKRGTLRTRQARKLPISDKILQDMTSDLLQITMRLVLLMFSHSMDDETRASLGKHRGRQWRYKQTSAHPQGGAGASK
jgi:hypothetical protein